MTDVEKQEIEHAAFLGALRIAHDAGYRSGYGNALYDADNAEGHDDNPRDSFELWLDDRAAP